MLIWDLLDGRLQDSRGLSWCWGARLALQGSDIWVIGIKGWCVRALCGLGLRIREVWVFAGFDGFGDPQGVVLGEFDLGGDLRVYRRPYMEEFEERVSRLESICGLPGRESVSVLHGYELRALPGRFVRSYCIISPVKDLEPELLNQSLSGNLVVNGIIVCRLDLPNISPV